MCSALLRVLALALLALCLAPSAYAQDGTSYPSRLIRMVIPQPPGAGTDVGGRLVAEAAEQHLGQRIVVENKPGAGGRIGASQVAKAAPDGYTILYSPKPPLSIVQYLKIKLDYDPVRDLIPVATRDLGARLAGGARRLSREDRAGVPGLRQAEPGQDHLRHPRHRR